MTGWRQVCAVLAFIIWMEATGRWDLAVAMPDLPAHRPPILELPPHVTLPWGDPEPVSPLDGWGTVRLAWQEVTDGTADSDHLPRRQILVAQPPVVAPEQLPPPPSPMGWLADDGGGMPMRPMRNILRVPPAFAFDDFAGFPPGPLFRQG